MRYSTETFTRQISWLRACLLETKQRLSSTLFFTAQEMQKSEVSLAEVQQMVEDLRQSSSAIRLLLESYEEELVLLVEEATFLAWMDEEWQYGQNTQH